MLPKILKDLMLQKSITARTLSKECAIPLSTIQSYISGKKAAYSAEHLIKLSEYFDVSLDFLMTSVENPKAQLNSIVTEDLFEGWLKVKIERAIPTKSSKKPE